MQKLYHRGKISKARTGDRLDGNIALGGIIIVVFGVVVVLTLKTVLASIQYLLFLTLQGKETNFRGHKLTQTKVQKNIIKTERKSLHSRKNM